MLYGTMAEWAQRWLSVTQNRALILDDEALRCVTARPERNWLSTANCSLSSRIYRSLRGRMV